MSDPFDFSDPPPRDRRDRRDDWEDDRPRRRPRDADWDDRPPRRRDDWDDRRPAPPAPKSVPAAVPLAGVAWLLFGLFNLLVGLLSVGLAVLGGTLGGKAAAHGRVQDVVIQLGVTGAISAVVGAWFLILGVGVLRGRPPDVLGRGIASLVAGGLLLLKFLVQLPGLLAIANRADVPDLVLALRWLDVLSAFLWGAVLGGVGLATVICRQAYVQWMSQNRRRAAASASGRVMPGDDFESTFG